MKLQTLVSKLPWALREILKHTRYVLSHRKPPFEKVLNSFSELPSSSGFVDDSWAESSRGALHRAQKNIGQAIPRISEYSKALLPMLLGGLGISKQHLRVLDFGGGAGLDFANLLACNGKPSSVTYQLVDLPNICKVGREEWRNSNEIIFSDTWPSSDERYDVVYSYSAIQYVEDYQSLFKRFADYKPEAILLCKHPIHEGPTFVRTQVNLRNSTAHWVLNIREVEKIFSTYGYVLTYRGWHENSYNVDNFDDPFKVSGLLNLLFVRKKYHL